MALHPRVIREQQQKRIKAARQEYAANMAQSHAIFMRVYREAERKFGLQKNLEGEALLAFNAHIEQAAKDHVARQEQHQHARRARRSEHPHLLRPVVTTSVRAVPR